MKRTFAGVALMMLAFVVAEAQDNSDRVVVNWSDPSRPGLVRVSLTNGGVTVRTHNGREVIIEGRALANRTQPATRDGLRRIDSTGGGLVIEEQNNVLTVSSRSFFGGGSLSIQVPQRTNLALSSVNGGAIAVEGVEGEIEVTNTNGNVRLTNVAGSVVAHATNGNLFATLRDITPNRPLSFTSMNANVDVTLPAATRANLRIRSDNGAAYSDFDIRITPSPPPAVNDTRSPPDGGPQNRVGRLRIETARLTTGTINGGGPDVEIRTLNGNIFLRKGQ